MGGKEIRDVIVTTEEIKERQPNPDNGCSYSYTAKANGQDLSICPRQNATDLFGFNMTLDLKIGANLYALVTAYGRAELSIPFRINVPELNPAVCANAASACSDLGVMHASFDEEMWLAFYYGYYVDFNELVETITKLASPTNKDKEVIQGFDFLLLINETKIGEYQVLEKRNLGCLAFEDNLDFLNDYYKKICCREDKSGSGKMEPVWIDLNDNGKDDRNEEYLSETESESDSESNSDKYGVLGITGVSIIVICVVGLCLFLVLFVCCCVVIEKRKKTKKDRVTFDHRPGNGQNDLQNVELQQMTGYR